MPQKSLKPCPHPGCSELIISGRCDKHKNVLQKELDARRGHLQGQRFKNDWLDYREGWMRAHPVCGDRLNGRSKEHSECARAGRVVAATDLDHIVAHRGDDDGLFWDPNNHQSLCKRCHGVKTANEVNARKALERLLNL